MMKQLRISDFEWQIIANPNALSKQRVAYKDYFLDQFTRHHIPFQFHVAAGALAGIELAKSLCESGCRHFMLIGGDGTVNEIINGIYLSNVDASEVYLAIIPLGTGNDFCRTHLYPQNKEEILQLILKGNFVSNDVGLVETVHESETVANRYFINIAGFAFDAAIIEKTVGKKPLILPAAVYLLNLVKVLFSYKAKETQIITPEKTMVDLTFTIAVGIGQYNGNGMKQVPTAKVNDRLFDVVYIRKVSPFKVALNVAKLFDGSHVEHVEEACTFKTNQLEIKSSSPYIPGEVEGELLKRGNYRLTIAAKQINILSALPSSCVL
ncbi:MAG: hypothetical protein M0P38_05715 [Bacteroidales bacterium]|jgi:diacylglycerol kinase (ATP)|nr:hypothetical protein [Bacteroidales bacterium]